MNSCPSCWMVWSICSPAAKDVGSALRLGPASSSAKRRLNATGKETRHGKAATASAVAGPHRPSFIAGRCQASVRH